ncbi:hypothetical protein NDU88_002954 [Pleurodeles waltl]|uniref:Uncharacterized protein n=1 Tax=Pleurodeles waltl TaxID=8319 RepID=A0AAV7T544_PLEWA|nr:hypothetical protein NDU88_002954 [Pleurodeles waltl]
MSRPHRNGTCAIPDSPDLVSCDWLNTVPSWVNERTNTAAAAIGGAIVGSGGGDLEDSDPQQGREEDELRRSEDTRGREEDKQANLKRVRDRCRDSGKCRSRRSPVNELGRHNNEPWGDETLIPATLLWLYQRKNTAAPAIGGAIVGSGGGDLEEADPQQGREEDELRRSEDTRGREEDEQANLKRVRDRWPDSGKC